MVSGASGAARSQKAQSWKGPNTIGTRERAWQKRQKTRRDIELGKRVGGSAYWRIGVWGSKTAFGHRYNDQEVSTELMMLCKRRHADTFP